MMTFNCSSRTRNPALLALSILLLSVTLRAAAQQEASTGSMTFKQARRAIAAAAPTQEHVHFRVTRDSVSFLGRVHDYRSLTIVQDVSLKLSEISGVRLVEFPNAIGWAVDIYMPGNRKRSGDIDQPGDYRFRWSTSKDTTAQHDAARFADALQWLVLHAADLPQSTAATEGFKERAATWRVLAAKPPMPDNAHEHAVLAMNAVQERNLNKAIDEYESALDIFPTWPEGHFNVALICGETGDYDCAVEHMQDYLELVPNAPDAQAAKDKIIIWKDKLSSSENSQAPPPQAASPNRK